MTTNRLYKSSTNKMIFGVCGGLADYFNVDPVLVRVAFVVLALANGIGLLIYLILAIVAPREETATGREEQKAESEGQVIDAAPSVDDAGRISRNPGASLARRRNGLALILIALGVLLLIVNLDLFRWLNWATFWPLLLIAAGAAILLSRFRRA